MNILLIGGTGTLGKTIFQIANRNHKFVILARHHVDWAEVFLGTIENIFDINLAIKKFNIDAILHLAANKYINLCENYPSQSIQHNIIGTFNVLKSVQMNNSIQKAIFVSSDKACNPTSVYGMSKHIGEKLVTEFSSGVDAKINSIRLGNIFGSFGSVIRIWLQSIKKNNQIVVKKFDEKETLKYALTPTEAASFCLSQLENDNQKGSVLVPKMPLLSMTNLSKAFCELHNCNIVFDKCYDYEKLVEDVISDGELKNTIEKNNYYEITNCLNNKLFRLKFHLMTYDETMFFLKQVEKEILLYNL